MSKRFLKYETEDVQNGTLPNISSDGVFKSAGGGSSVQTDWNQTDETQPDYIKNKPFGTLYGKEIVNVIIPLPSTSQDSDGNYLFPDNELPIHEDPSFVGPVDITLNGKSYENIQVHSSSSSNVTDYIFETDGLPFSLTIAFYEGDRRSYMDIKYSNSYVGDVIIYDKGKPYDKPLPTRYLDIDYLSENYFPVCNNLSDILKGQTLVYDANYKKFTPSYDVYLRSSTSGSMKTFKLTVDDSGTLSATEVTT